jgi:hypothetical protein
MEPGRSCAHVSNWKAQYVGLIVATLSIRVIRAIRGGFPVLMQYAG